MQPYFFPYLGYFSLMGCADEFILFDTPQYDRKGWMHRNRILKPDDGWQYIHAGVIKPSFKACIKDVMIDQTENWKQLLLRQLEHYRVSASYYDDVLQFVSSVLTEPAYTLTQLNRNILTSIRDRLGLVCNIHTFSEMGIEIGSVEHAGQWALRIAESLNADVYVNPIGGAGIFNPQEFSQSGIEIKFLRQHFPEYNQGRSHFEAGLSILDVFFFNALGKVTDMIFDYDTI